jgi:hypothetical protein
MSGSYGPLWTRGYTNRSRGGYVSPDLRVSDSERHEVADRLSKHFADGRLDPVEFNERLDRAMGATTRSDLSGLFNDLPAIEGTDVATRQRRRHPHHYRFLFLVLIVAIAAMIGQSMVQSNLPWVLVGLLAFFWFRYGSWHRRS